MWSDSPKLEARKEVIVDDADDVESVSHDACIEDVEPDQRTVVGGPIHAHHPHLAFAFQPLRIGL
jgi:hypothetical protein